MRNEQHVRGHGVTGATKKVGGVVDLLVGVLGIDGTSSIIASSGRQLVVEENETDGKQRAVGGAGL